MLNESEKKFRNRQFGALILMNFLSGWFVASVGPLIPHYTTVTGLDETDYAYLFMVRSAANVMGGLFSKYLLHKLKVSALTIIYLLVVVVSLIASTLSLSTFNLSITLFCSSICLVGIADII
jgi:fucose permease